MLIHNKITKALENTLKKIKYIYGEHFQHSIDQPVMVVNPARDQLNRENEYFPVRVRAREFGLARQVRLSRPASACSFSTLRLNLLIVHTHGIPPTINRHRVSPAFIRSRNCVPMAFTAESPLPQGQ